ncbi:MAG TPA: molybdopterin-dependent oxidoreductase [Stenotrophomonas sp.]|nr:molybdopterin-dependent oxidoreductase [Stenotrophomonas sp.]
MNAASLAAPLLEASLQQRTTRSTCCYCGVGCGVLIHSEHGPGGEAIVGIEGDPDHPANHGRLCSKGRALPQSVASHAGRLLAPQLRVRRDQPRREVDWERALEHVAARMAAIVREHGPDAVAFYLSGQLLTEDYYVFNKLAKGLLGTANIDTNSRLCMSSAVSAYKRAFGADGPPTCYEDLEHARTVLFAGSNMAYAHPVLFRRLEQAREAHPDTRWIVVDPRRTGTAAMADLHLAIQPGTDVALFNGILHHLVWEGWLDEAYIQAHTNGFAALKQLLRDYTPRVSAELCGIAVEDLIQAAEWIGRSPAFLSLYCMGLNQSVHGTDKNLALINLHLATGQIGRAGAGPFSLTGQPNAMGGREVGGMATMLAAHRELGDPGDRADLEALWQLPPGRLPAAPGATAVPLFEGLRAGKIKAVWIACTNPVHSMPDVARVREALAAAELVIVQEAFADTDTLPFADVVLPASSWGEKEGTVTNSERRITRVRAAVAPPGQARADSWIACEIARRLERRLVPAGPSLFGFDTPAQIFDEHRSLTVGRDLDIGGLDYPQLERGGPQQWPYPAGATQGLLRRYTDGCFATDDGRGNFHAAAYRPVAEATSARYPLRLLTGRLRDQWHGMSRTGRIAEAYAHCPEPGLRMHPDDAARRGLAAGALVRVSSKRGALVLPLELSDEVRSGCVFAAMHWSGQQLACNGINELSTPAFDATSQQPELKHAAVRVEPAEFGWYLLAARRGDALALRAALQPLLRECGYASLVLHAENGQARGSAWVVLRAACTQRPSPEWWTQLEAALALPASPDLLEYQDARRGILRRVGWRRQSDGDYFDGVLLTDPQPSAASQGLLQTALAAQPWQGPRLAVFAPGASVARDPIVCSCRQVALSAIQAEIARGADVPTLKQRLGCGSECGSCVPQLLQLCRQAALA